MTKKYFVSFIEEGILNPDYKGYVAGRVEVNLEGAVYAVEEIRFLTDKRDEFYRFREKWDFKDVDQEELDEVRTTIKERYI